MSSRAALILGVLFAVLVAVQLVLLVAGRAPTPATAGIAIGATSGGIPHAPSAGRVDVHAHGRRGASIARGELGESLAVPAGRYDIELTVTKSVDRLVLMIEDVALEPGAHFARQLEIPAGELEVEALVGGDDGSDRRVMVHVFRHGDRDRPVTIAPAGARMLIGAGRYDLRVVYHVGSAEKGVRWLEEVDVEPGLRTHRRVRFERGALVVEARNGGTTLPAGAVELSVFAAGDRDERLVERGVAGRPVELPAGRYDVEVVYSAASDRPARWLRDLEIPDGGHLERSAEFASGSAIVDAEIGTDEPLPSYDVYVYFYRAGDHEQAVAYVPAGEPVVLERGSYDVRAHFFRSTDQPSAWLRGLRLGAGETVRETIRFDSGRLLVRALDERGEEIVGDNGFVHVHAPGERDRAIAVARTGHVLTLRAGRYDLRVEDTRRVDGGRWINDVEVSSGELVERTVGPGARGGSLSP